MDRVFTGEVGATSRIGRIHRGLDSIRILSKHQTSRRAFVATAKHPLPQYPGNGANDVAHGLEFRAGDDVFVPQADTVGTLLGFLLAGLGGCIAITPTPATRSGGVMGTLSRLTPQGNAVEGYYAVMAEGLGIPGIATELLALAGFALAFVVVAAWRFRYES